MSEWDETISADRVKIQIYPFTQYIFWLIESRPFNDAYQSCLYVNREESHQLEYQPSRDDEEMYSTPLDARLVVATAETVIRSLSVLHHDFLTKHGIAIEGNTPNESLELPDDFAPS